MYIKYLFPSVLTQYILGSLYTIVISMTAGSTYTKTTC